MNKKRVLFICSKNSCRSQMAEAFLRKLGAQEFDVFSAGLKSDKLDPMALQVMQEIGYSMEGHFSKSLDQYLNERFSFLITVCDKAERSCPVFFGVSIREYWPIDDPATTEGSVEIKLNAYRQVRDEIMNRVQAFLEAEKNS